MKDEKMPDRGEQPKYDEYHLSREYATDDVKEFQTYPEYNGEIGREYNTEDVGEFTEIGIDQKATPRGGGKTVKPKHDARKLARGFTAAVSGLAAVATVVIILLGFNLGSLPDAEEDLFVGADFIEYNIDIRDLGDYDLTIRLSNDRYEGYEVPAVEGRNIGLIEGLQPETVYKLTVAGRNERGRATLISKNVRTAGSKPTADVRRALREDCGTSVDLAFSDPKGRIENPSIAYLADDGRITGERPVEAKTGRVLLEGLYARRLTVILYGDLSGERVQLAKGEFSLAREPGLWLSVEKVGQNRALVYVSVDKGDAEDLALTLTGPDGSKTEQTLRFDASHGNHEGESGMRELSFMCALPEKADGATVKAELTYTLDGKEGKKTKTASLDGGEREYTAVIKTLRDFGDAVELTLETDIPHELAERGEVRLVFYGNGGSNETPVSSFEEPLTVRGLEPGCFYFASLRVGDREIDLGEVRTLREVTFGVDFSRDGSEFVLRSDDLYAYYSDFEATLTAQSGEEIPLRREGGRFFTDGASGIYTLKVTALSAKPGDSGRVTVYTVKIAL